MVPLTSNLETDKPNPWLWLSPRAVPPGCPPGAGVTVCSICEKSHSALAYFFVCIILKHLFQTILSPGRCSHICWVLGASFFFRPTFSKLRSVCYFYGETLSVLALVLLLLPPASLASPEQVLRPVRASGEAWPWGWSARQRPLFAEGACLPETRTYTPGTFSEAHTAGATSFPGTQPQASPGRHLSQHTGERPRCSSSPKARTASSLLPSALEEGTGACTPGRVCLTSPLCRGHDALSWSWSHCHPNC